MKLFAVTLLLAASWASSCNTKPETVAVRALAADKGFIESEMGKHGDCQPGATPTTSSPQLCKLLNDGIAAQHSVVLTLDAYCASPDYLKNQGPCSPPSNATIKADLQSKLQTAVSNLDGIVKSIKSIAGGK